MLYLISFYAPAEHVEKIKDAMFVEGAGKIGSYAHCSWQTLGEGQYMPLAGSEAFQGKINEIEKCTEYKVEMTCKREEIQAVMHALLKAHPYEVPAYQIIEFLEITDL